MSAPRRSPGGRWEAASVFSGALLAALLILVAVAQDWASGQGRTAQALIVLHRQVSGRTAAPLTAAAGIVALAGAASIPAARGRGRQLAGVLLVVAGVAGAVEALIRRGTAQRDVRHQLPAGAKVDGSGWAYLAFVGALLLIAVGAAMMARGARWPSLSARYENASGRTSTPAGSRPPGEAGMWDALDRGDDPTRDAPDAQR